MTEQECPYGPRHRHSAATANPLCTWCGRPIPEPWYMHRRPDPVDLVAEVAARHGVTIPPRVAREIADALLRYADCAMEIREIVHRQAWQKESYRQHIRESMRARLLEEIVKHGRIPAALPSEAIRYLAAPVFFADQDKEPPEVPAEAVKQGAPYEMVQVVLAVQVRTPAVDRAAAVRAGVL